MLDMRHGQRISAHPFAALASLASSPPGRIIAGYLATHTITLARWRCLVDLLAAHLTLALWLRRAPMSG